MKVMMNFSEYCTESACGGISRHKKVDLTELDGAADYSEQSCEV